MSAGDARCMPHEGPLQSQLILQQHQISHQRDGHNSPIMTIPNTAYNNVSHRRQQPFSSAVNNDVLPSSSIQQNNDVARSSLIAPYSRSQPNQDQLASNFRKTSQSRFTSKDMRKLRATANPYVNEALNALERRKNVDPISPPTRDRSYSAVSQPVDPRRQFQQ